MIPWLNRLFNLYRELPTTLNILRSLAWVPLTVFSDGMIRNVPHTLWKKSITRDLKAKEHAVDVFSRESAVMSTGTLVIRISSSQLAYLSVHAWLIPPLAVHIPICGPCCVER